ncbi:hypothetical protein F4141_01370 [Candidatus Poribacteria bacterium]|nr:hypothetical protein [Candidatus Poribacteria bacterium]MYH79341.1 hypothetical protein [Candidatus Poribacteria bacterium]
MSRQQAVRTASDKKSAETLAPTMKAIAADREGQEMPKQKHSRLLMGELNGSDPLHFGVDSHYHLC